MFALPAIHEKTASKAAMTLVEVLVSATLLSVVMAGLAGVASMCRSYIRSQQETSAASYAMEQTFDEINGAGWGTVTNGDSLDNLLTNMDSRRLSELRDAKVRVTVNAYPPLSPQPAPLVVERAPDGTSAVISAPPSGVSLRSLLAVRIDVRVSWTSANKSRPHFREVSSVLALAGLLK